MVKADTGVEFTADKVVIRPTGAATAMMGGAFVTVDQHTLGDGIDMRHPGMDLVFAPDGKLVSYLRFSFGPGAQGLNQP